MSKPNQNKSVSLPPEQIAMILANQSKELQMRAQEMQLRQEDLTNQFKLADKSLDYQKEDIKHQRNYDYKVKLTNYILGTFIGLVVLGFIIWLVYIEKETLAALILGYIGTALVSIAGGYVAGLRKGSKNSSE